MDAEQLRMILDAVANVSNDASTLVIWWMVLHYGTTVLGYVSGAVACVFCFRCFADIWRD